MTRTGKHSSLVTKNEAKADRRARVSGEAMVKPSTELTITPPAELKGNKIACATWKYILKLQLETEAGKSGNGLITAFDKFSLIAFCEMVAEERELKAELVKVGKAKVSIQRKVLKMRPNAENLKEYVSLLSQLNALINNFKGMSARLDSHRNSRQEFGKSMYLTPTSRAGVAPPAAESDEPKSEMEKLL